MTKTISCCALMISFNRFPSKKNIPEEAIASFMYQTYPNKKLIILNLQPKQKIISNHPDIYVINFSEIPESFGQAYNIAIEKFPCDYYLMWDDDDISLPWRISESVRMVTQYQLDYWNPKRQHFLEVTMTDQSHYHPTVFIYDESNCVCHNASIFSYRSWKIVGGYPNISGNQDYFMELKLTSHQNVQYGYDIENIEPSKIHHIYRWGFHQHASTYANNSFNDEHNKKIIHQLINSLPEEFYGTYELPVNPQWKYDYLKIVQQANHIYKHYYNTWEKTDRGKIIVRLDLQGKITRTIK